MDLEIETLDAGSVRARFSALPLREGEIAVYDRDGGLITPVRAVMAAIRRAEVLFKVSCIPSFRLGNV